MTIDVPRIRHPGKAFNRLRWAPAMSSLLLNGRQKADNRNGETDWA
jgi:hypothetical protein